MRHAPGARFGHNSIEHQMDVARRGWAREQGAPNGAPVRYGNGEVVRSLLALTALFVVMGVVVLLAWSAGVFSSP